MQNAQQQLSGAENLTVLWMGLLPEYEVPTQRQFLIWAGMISEEAAVYAVNRAARKARREPMAADRIGRYITGILKNEREGKRDFNPRTFTTSATAQ